MVVLGEESAPVAYRPASTDALYATIEAIASGTRGFEYMEPSFADGRATQGLSRRFSLVRTVPCWGTYPVRL